MTNIEKKIDEIFSRLDEIEKRVGIQPKKLSDFMDEAYSVKDASKILGCTMEKVRQFIKYDFWSWRCLVWSPGYFFPIAQGQYGSSIFTFTGLDLGRGDDTFGNPHRAQISQFELIPY